MKSLRISNSLTLPLDAVTQTFAILAVRGAGKSNLAAVMAEEMFESGLPFVVVDPVGAWYGLRARADGTPGLPVVIFGGRHGDVPLERAAGQMLADLVTAERVSCVLDLSEFSEGDKTRFLIEFAERLYRKNEAPLHLFLEEADDFIPQRPFREQARLVRAWENVVRRGRSRGLGMTMITQRSAALNKNVLTQAETLFILRTTSPQDRKAIEAWVEFHGQAKEILESLSALNAGEAWVWSPQWLRVCTKVQVRRRETFDSGATPKMSKGARPAATLADVDLGAIQVRMRETIERAKADDPRELKKRIAELEREIRGLKAVEVVAERVEVPAVDADTVSWLEGLLGAAGRISQEIETAGDRIQKALDRARPPGISPGINARPSPTTPAVATVAREMKREPRASNGSGERLASGERRILTALAQYPDGRTKKQVAVLTGYAVNGGGFANYLGALRTSNRIQRTTDDRFRITDDGLEVLGDFTPLPHGADLVAHWMGQLSKAERAILQVVINAHPRALSREQIAPAAGYEASGGGFNNALGRLRTLELIHGRGEIRAAEEFFQ